MRRNKRAQAGYALITAMAVGVVALSITGALLLRMSNSTKQIGLRESTDAAHSISESVLNSVLDAIADTTAKTEDATSSTEVGIYVSAKSLADYLNTNNYLNGSSDNDNAANSIVMQRPGGSLPSGYSLTKFDTTTTKSWTTFWNSLETNAAHSTEFWNSYRNTSSSNKLNVSGLTLAGTTINAYSTSNPDGFSMDNLHSHAYSIYHVTKGSLQADVVVSIVPLATNISDMNDQALHAEASFKNHNDVFKIRVDTYMPGLTASSGNGDPKLGTPRDRMDVIVNRPVLREDSANYDFRHAVLAGGDVDLQNFDTSSGPCAADDNATCIDTTTSGDVHTNGNLSIGSNGHVQGKATASGNVNVSGTLLPTTDYTGAAGDPRDTSGVTSHVDNSHDSQSGVDQIPIPKLDTSTTAIDATPCVDSNPDPDIVTYANCKLTGALDVNNNKFVEYQGTVHITGNVDIKGSQRCTGSVPCKIVIDGTVNVGGNGDSTWNSTQESLYVVNGNGVSAGSDCLDIGGNPDAAGQYGSLFYINNEDCNTRVRGNSEFFGGIITKGTVNTVGNATDFGIQRDSDMSALSIFVQPEPVPKEALFPAVISWKDLR